MKKLWTFGDSFTYGVGLIGPFHQYWYKDKFKELIFPIQLAKKLDCILINEGRGGSSSMTILFSLIKHLPLISSGDTVVIGLTKKDRYRLQVDDEKHIEFHPGLADEIYSTINNANGEFKGSSQVDDISKFYTHKELESILNYYLVQFPNKADYYEKQYVELFLSLQQLLINRDINTVVWHSDIWDYGENIEKWTSELGDLQILDGHWSPNGHNTFTDIIYYAISNNHKYIDLSYVKGLTRRSIILPSREYVKPPISSL